MGLAAAMAPARAPDKQGFLDELRMRATESPAAWAILVPGGTAQPLTFANLWRRMQGVGEFVANAGFTHKDVIAVVMPDGPDLLTLVPGVASAAICAPLNPALRTAEFEASLRDLGARALIVDPAFGATAGEAARRMGLLVLDAASALGESSLSSLSSPAVAPAKGSDVALVLQTSATTGAKARLVQITHSNLRAMAANTREILQLTAQDRFLSLMPLFHLQGLLSSLAQLLAGGSVISASGFDAGSFLATLEEFRPTWYTASPALHHAILPLMEAAAGQGMVLDGRIPLRFVRSIGAPMQRGLLEKLERVLHVPVLEGYGMTEAGMVTSNAPPPQKRKPGSAGRSASCMELGILGDSGTLLEAGREGEIAVRGPAVMPGYRNDPDAGWHESGDGWFLTGDIGYLDDEGFLFVSGRKKDIINRGGEKILPSEIDEALAAHPLVSEAVAFGVPHPTLGEDVAAAVVLESGQSMDPGELRRFTAQRLADYKVPRRIVFLDAIPKGPTGKARRSLLAEQFPANEPAIEQKATQALSPVESKLATAWKRILRIDHIGVDDDFFAAGGDSLALTLLMSEMEFEFGVGRGLLDGSEFFSTPTIRTLAELIARHGEPAAGHHGSRRLPLVVLQALGAGIPFFCIPGADENPYYLVDLAQSLGQDRPFYVPRDPRAIEQRGVYTVEEHAAHYTAVIRGARPQGPYLLGGHCYGGILAFEIARQLIAKGEEVRLLAMLEVPTPGYPKVARNWRNYLHQSKRSIAALWRGEDHPTWSDVWNHVRVLAGLWKRNTRIAARRGLMSSGLKAVVEPLDDADYFRNTRAGRSYVPGELRCKVVQFIAADEQHSTLVLDDPRLGWGDFIGDGFSVRKTPGKADAIFKQPNVGELALQLRRVLDEVDDCR